MAEPTAIPTWERSSVFCPLAGNCEGLIALPACIDPHVHLRVPGEEHKEDWKSGARAALAGGITTLFDMPNNHPPCIDEAALKNKQQQVNAQLAEVGIPLRYFLYLGAARTTLPEVEAGKIDSAIAIKLFMGSSTGSLLIDDPADQERFFAAAARYDIPIAVHAEDEAIIAQCRKEHLPSQDPSVHSKVRPPAAAEKATARAIALAERYGTRLYLLHVSTEGEVEQIYRAKQRGLALLAEATPHHLFLDEEAYSVHGTLAQVNPPLRTAAHRSALLSALAEGVIDTVGSDHAPHTVEEKSRPYGLAPSGIAGLETTLPLLLTAHLQGKLSLKRIVEATSSSVRQFFRLPPCDDLVIVDMTSWKSVSPELWHSKARLSPFSGWSLTGWPQFIRLRGKWYSASQIEDPFRQECDEVNACY